MYDINQQTIYSIIAPLINIKKAITTIRTDIMEMDVRIGVLQHGYFMSKVHEKSIIQDTIIRPLFPSTVLWLPILSTFLNHS